LFVAPPPARAQSLGLDRERSRIILGVIKREIKDNYYDPNFRGMDIEARFKAADEKLKQANSLGQMFSIIAQTLSEFEDSHTFFIPPGRTVRTDYGWKMKMVGDKCLVTAVSPGSDAAAKGLKIGDEIYEAEGFGLTRDNLWKFNYVYNVLRPQPAMRLVVLNPAGEQRPLEIAAKVKTTKLLTDLTQGGDIWELIREEENEDRLNRHRYQELGDDLLIWKMPAFDLSREKVDEMMEKARKHKALIMDLRGNSGGAEETLLRLVGNFFKNDIKVGDLKRRKEERVLLAKARGEQAYDGKLIVLVDSESGSAAELFARVVQLEKRGVVLGDRTAGAVMRSKSIGRRLGADTVIFYGVSVTDADLVMGDGKSLEKNGVSPDELRLPTAEDVASGRDPVLAYAASLAGVALEPAKAGAMFPVEWRK
jgi:carboxyl-terminal processing protease